MVHVNGASEEFCSHAYVAAWQEREPASVTSGKEGRVVSLSVSLDVSLPVSSTCPERKVKESVDAGVGEYQSWFAEGVKVNTSVEFALPERVISPPLISAIPESVMFPAASVKYQS